jgi:hypothetical protein
VVVVADVGDDRGVVALLRIDVVHGEALVERGDEPLGRVGRDEVTVHLDDVGDDAAGSTGRELLGVERRLVDRDLDVPELVLRVVEAGGAHLVGVVETPGRELPGRVVGEGAVLTRSGAGGAPAQHQEGGSAHSRQQQSSHDDSSLAAAVYPGGGRERNPAWKTVLSA